MTAQGVPDSELELEPMIDELDHMIKDRETWLARDFKKTTDPKSQVSSASIVAAIKNRSETNSIYFDTLKVGLLTRELQEVSAIKSHPFS